MSVWERERIDLPREIVLSHVQAAALLEAQARGRRQATVSLDLGLSEVTVALDDGGVRLPGPSEEAQDSLTLPWSGVHEIASAETGCFLVEEDDLWRIKLFSEASNCLYSLMPTAGAPTMLISGVPMHRTKGIDPYQDTQRKIKALTPLAGRVLDTATGLGYTAIEAARAGGRVTTLEIEPTVLELASYNPWSRPLFTDARIARRIARRVGDAAALVETFDEATFDVVIHDPPAFSLAGALYGGAFYRQLHRLLRPGGRMFHYIGDLDSRLGRSVAGGAVRRLRKAGFARVERRPQAFGLLVTK